ncbi:MAG: 16S rRNA (cytosine(967)-C(5))-methyltransferase RsmB [Dictyoglomaceae bacterium]|nr:16S rRNA (cytosine(967)-C(5))-methyltransferase RsmB [Dictyoglomaceae bacterium]
MEVRLRAGEILYEIEKREGYANLILRSSLPSLNLSLKEKKFITELVYGILRWQLTLDEIWKGYVKYPDHLTLWAKILLRMAVYHVYFIKNTNIPMAMNEIVEISKIKSKKEKNLINAVVRKISSEKISIESFPLHIKFSHPSWILEELEDYLGEDYAIKIAEWNNSPSFVSIRINTLKTTKEEIKELFKKDNIEVKDGFLVPQGLIIEEGMSFENYHLFKKGFFTIQSEASILTSIILDPKPNEKVADLCSAPGTKSTHLAELMENKGEIFSVDINKSRLNLVEKNAKRLGINIIKTLNYDVLNLPEELNGTFDKVLLDVPCTGLGVLKHKPEIKWRREREDIYKLSKLQYSMLERAGKLLKKGGEILYCTCTLTWQENEGVVLSFLQKYPSFYFKPFTFNNKKFPGILRIIPFIYNTDGFFISLLKNEE